MESGIPLPFSVEVSTGEWIIDHPRGEILLIFDVSQWASISFDHIEPLYYEGGPALQHRAWEDCVLSLNIGGGLPMDWRKQSDEVQVDKHIFEQATFYDAQGDVQFVIYDQLFRVTFGDEQGTCLQAVESVLESLTLPQGWADHVPGE